MIFGRALRVSRASARCASDKPEIHKFPSLEEVSWILSPMRAEEPERTCRHVESLWLHHNCCDTCAATRVQTAFVIRVPVGSSIFDSLT